MTRMNSDKYLTREVRGKLYYIEKSKFIEICNELDKENKEVETMNTNIDNDYELLDPLKAYEDIDVIIADGIEITDTSTIAIYTTLTQALKLKVFVHRKRMTGIVLETVIKLDSKKNKEIIGEIVTACLVYHLYNFTLNIVDNEMIIIIYDF